MIKQLFQSGMKAGRDFYESPFSQAIQDVVSTAYEDYGTSTVPSAAISAGIGGVIAGAAGGPVTLGAFAGLTTAATIRRAAPHVAALSQHTGVLSGFTMDRRYAMLAGAGLSGFASSRKSKSNQKFNRGRGSRV